MTPHMTMHGNIARITGARPAATNQPQPPKDNPIPAIAKAARSKNVRLTSHARQPRRAGVLDDVWQLDWELQDFMALSPVLAEV